MTQNKQVLSTLLLYIILASPSIMYANLDGIDQDIGVIRALPDSQEKINRSQSLLKRIGIYENRLDRSQKELDIAMRLFSGREIDEKEINKLPQPRRYSNEEQGDFTEIAGYFIEKHDIRSLLMNIITSRSTAIDIGEFRDIRNQVRNIFSRIAENVEDILLPVDANILTQTNNTLQRLRRQYNDLDYIKFSTQENLQDTVRDIFSDTSYDSVMELGRIQNNINQADTSYTNNSTIAEKITETIKQHIPSANDAIVRELVQKIKLALDNGDALLNRILGICNEYSISIVETRSIIEQLIKEEVIKSDDIRKDFSKKLLYAYLRLDAHPNPIMQNANLLNIRNKIASALRGQLNDNDYDNNVRSLREIHARNPLLIEGTVIGICGCLRTRLEETIERSTTKLLVDILAFDASKYSSLEQIITDIAYKNLLNLPNNNSGVIIVDGYMTTKDTTDNPTNRPSNEQYQQAIVESTNTPVQPVKMEIKPILQNEQTNDVSIEQCESCDLRNTIDIREGVSEDTTCNVKETPTQILHQNNENLATTDTEINGRLSRSIQHEENQETKNTVVDNNLNLSESSSSTISGKPISDVEVPGIYNSSSSSVDLKHGLGNKEPVKTPPPELLSRALEPEPTIQETDSGLSRALLFSSLLYNMSYQHQYNNTVHHRVKPDNIEKVANNDVKKADQGIDTRTGYSDQVYQVSMPNPTLDQEICRDGIQQLNNVLFVPHNNRQPISFLLLNDDDSRLHNNKESLRLPRLGQSQSEMSSSIEHAQNALQAYNISSLNIDVSELIKIDANDMNLDISEVTCSNNLEMSDCDVQQLTHSSNILNVTIDTKSSLVDIINILQKDTAHALGLHTNVSNAPNIVELYQTKCEGVQKPNISAYSVTSYISQNQLSYTNTIQKIQRPIIVLAILMNCILVGFAYFISSYKTGGMRLAFNVNN